MHNENSEMNSSRIERNLGTNMQKGLKTALEEEKLVLIIGIIKKKLQLRRCSTLQEDSLEWLGDLMLHLKEIQEVKLLILQPV